MEIDAQKLLRRAERFIAVEGHIQHPDFEQAMAFALCEEMQQAGIHSRCIPVAPKRWNVMCTLEGAEPGRTLVLNTHLDTVPAYGMKNAFVPRRENGRLYGRGAVDVRGVLACLCECMIALKRMGRPKKGRVILLATCDEESGSIGARAALQTLRADGAIVCEATDLKLGLAHKGVEWFRAQFTGVATHSGAPENGVNAIYGAARFVDALCEYERNVLAQRKHPLIGHSTLSVGVIKGGSKATVVPNACIVELDRRWIPGETRASALAELEVLLRESAREDVGTCAGLTMLLGDDSHEFNAMETPRSAPLLEALETAHRSLWKSGELYSAVPFWTEAALFQQLGGIPAVVVGPGNVMQAHSDDEFVEIAQLEQAAQLYLQAALLFCEKKKGDE